VVREDIGQHHRIGALGRPARVQRPALRLQDGETVGEGGHLETSTKAQGLRGPANGFRRPCRLAENPIVDVVVAGTEESFVLIQFPWHRLPPIWARANWPRECSYPCHDRRCD